MVAGPPLEVTHDTRHREWPLVNMEPFVLSIYHPIPRVLTAC